ncbi:PR domain zinc finger protein 5 [Folsomia candida]|uniref:Zinc finger protein 37 n=1 Tax=Folsomia candida TaxID=158441 RepID=A0A226DQ89_FOLCA|nr:PR domain zinc finger protein 5 [Folsomia candida]OXA47383.1 Zinc finger protein 37 [Folsomia candida]
MDSKPENKWWNCAPCKLRFIYKSEFVRHLLKHETNVKCEICGLISKNRLALSSHVAKIHGNRIRPACSICNKTLSNQANLRKHLDTVHNMEEDRPRFPCGFPGCEKSYLTKGDLTKHVKAGHVENPVRFPCTRCGKEFKTRAYLGRHVSTHTTDKPCKCATCGKCFACRRYMTIHKRIHTQKSGRETFQCHLCLQTFLTKYGVQRHIRVIHEKQRNHRCTFCEKSFSSPSHLKNHVDAKHDPDKKIYTCTECEYKSHAKGKLAQHVKRHDVSNWRECYFCKKQFASFPELVRHFGRIHTLEK